MAISSLLQGYIKWPEINDYANIARIFLNRTRHFPGIIGAIDGCHIECKQPAGNEVDYYNRKGTHSIILQGTCDHRGKFIDIYVGSPGRMHDARVFRNSPLHERIIAADGLIPQKYHLLGDSAYPLMINILTPFRNTGHLTASQIQYNNTQSSARSIIERAFGLLKSKFRRLKYLDIKDLALGNHMIVAACVLRNFILEKESIEVDNYVAEANDDVEHYGVEEAQYEVAAVEKRNEIVNRFL